MKPVLLALVAAVAVTAVAAAAAPDWASVHMQPYEPPKAAPAFTLPDLEGRPHSLESLRGKVVLLFFWTTWCPDCRKDLPSVDTLFRNYRSRGLEVRLINFREDPDMVRRAVAERGYGAPVLLDESGDLTGRIYGVWGPPTAYLLDRQGRLVARATGPIDWSSRAARTVIEALLAPQR